MTGVQTCALPIYSSITSRGFTQAFDQIRLENIAKNRVPIWEAEPVGRGGGEGEGTGLIQSGRPTGSALARCSFPPKYTPRL